MAHFLTAIKQLSGSLLNYYKHVGFNQYNYDVDTIPPYTLQNGDVINFDFTLVDYETKESRLDVHLDVMGDTQDIEYEIIYYHDVITDYNSWEPIVDVIYSDNTTIVVGITVFDMKDSLVFNSFYIFDSELNLQKTIDLPIEITAGRIYKVNGDVYMLSKNFYDRKTHILKMNHEFEIEEIIPIKTDTDYFLANDIKFYNNLIYVAGNEYETKTKEGFVEYFSGVINIYSPDLTLVDQIYTKTGVGLNEIVIHDDQIYTAGLFNTYIGVDYNNDYAWCGVFSVVDSRDRNFILAFTHRKDR